VWLTFQVYVKYSLYIPLQYHIYVWVPTNNWNQYKTLGNSVAPLVRSEIFYVLPVGRFHSCLFFLGSVWVCFLGMSLLKNFNFFCIWFCYRLSGFFFTSGGRCGVGIVFVIDIDCNTLLSLGWPFFGSLCGANRPHVPSSFWWCGNGFLWGYTRSFKIGFGLRRNYIFLVFNN